MITGLYLGKFTPLHVGHESIVRRALEECDILYVMIYDSPKVTDVPLSVRARWFDRFGSMVNIIKCWNGPEEHGYSKRVIKLHDDYILKQLDGTKIDRFYSAEKYGDHVSKALNCMDCRCPKVPDEKMCATYIRADMFGRNTYLHPDVYVDHVVKCVFMGGPSTGKSTLAEILAKEFNTVFVEEYGRKYWEEHQVDRKLSYDDLEQIAGGHVDLEYHSIRRANKYMFVDTNAITTHLFGRYYGHNDLRTKRGLVGKLAEQCRDRYDIFFLCDDDFPMDETWDRPGDGQRKLLQAWTIDELKTRRIPYHVLSGSIKDRVKKVKAILKTYQKWR